MARTRRETLRARICSANTVRALWALLVVCLIGDLVWLDMSSGRVYSGWLAPQPILSVATLILGFFVLSWQIGKQHENTLEANRRTAQDRPKLDIYQEIAQRVEATTAPLARVGMMPTGFVGELVMMRKVGGLGRD